jgi:phospho-N-acetylmuramoyl-pentapeptide-transferase
MGGALILIAIIITTLLWGDLSNRYVWVVLIVTVGFGGIGWYDDWQKVVSRDPRGLPARWKYFWQSAIGLLVALYLGLTASGPAQLELIVPFFKTVAYPLGLIGFVVLSYLVVVGTSNAVNLTDGLDGLAIMPTVMIAAALTIFAYVAGNAVYAKYLFLPYPGRRRTGHPARRNGRRRARFPVVQCLSGGSVHGRCRRAGARRCARHGRHHRSPGNRAGDHGRRLSSPKRCRWRRRSCYYKLTGGRRIFRMAPLHHHFELGGWKETQVVVRFWIITIMLVLVGLSTLKLRCADMELQGKTDTGRRPRARAGWRWPGGWRSRAHGARCRQSSGAAAGRRAALGGARRAPVSPVPSPRRPLPASP